MFSRGRSPFSKGTGTSRLIAVGVIPLLHVLVLLSVQYHSNVSYHLLERHVSFLLRCLVSLETRLVPFKSCLICRKCTASTSGEIKTDHRFILFIWCQVEQT